MHGQQVGDTAERRAGQRRPVVRLVAVMVAVALLAVVAVLVVNGRNDRQGVTGGPNHEKQQAAVVSDGPGPDIEHYVEMVLEARNLKEAERSYRALFRAAGVAGLPALKRHQHDGVALQAAWEEVVLTLPKNLERPERPEKLEWFLGFLERRLRVEVPQWWAEKLLDARAHQRHNIYFVLKERRYHQAGLERFAPLGTTLKRERGKVVLTIDGQSATIPEDILSYYRRRVSGLMTPTRCYVAVHDPGGSLYQLTCIDRASEKVLWKSHVWAGWDGGGHSEAWVTVTEQDGRVVVFGAASMGIHVEAFRADNGANLFRFAGGTDVARALGR